MGTISIEGMEFYAYHGHYDEEKTTGNRFIVDIWLETNTKSAEKSDHIKDALNYQEVYVVVKKTMEQNKYNLLECIASKILDKLFLQFPAIDAAKIKVSKMNPAMGGQIALVSLCIERIRESKF